MAELNNNTALIGDEFQKAKQIMEGVPTSVGMLNIKNANQTLAEASRQQNPKPLWYDFWYEHEVCYLFADSNLGKSILAVQIGIDIASKGEKVLYFDFELSEKQFQLRFTDENGKLFQFPESFYRVSLDPDSIANLERPFEDVLIENIEQAAVYSGAKILIIDNISVLCIQMEKGEDTGILVQKLRMLKNKYELSILAIAHTPKRNMSCVITQNDLAGSKKLFNFIDSCFAIGKSIQGPNIRYVKQIKVRNCEEKYGTDNVMTFSIEKKDAMLQFVYKCESPEYKHLKVSTKADQIEEVKRLAALGNSIRDISKKTGIPKSTVDRMLHAMDEVEQGVPDSEIGQSGQLGQSILESSQSSQTSQLPFGTEEGGGYESDAVPF